MLSNIEVMMLEMSLVEHNKGAPLIAEVLNDVQQYGFVLSDIVEEHRFGGHLMQVDGIFLRKDSIYRAQPPFA